jgi:globin
MEHRRFLAHPEAHRAFIGSDVLRRIGGTAAVDALIDGLYDKLETDSALLPPFSRDLANGRQAQRRFFVEWLGGERSYSSTTHLPLKNTATISCRSRVCSPASGSSISATRSTSR